MPTTPAAKPVIAETLLPKRVRKLTLLAGLTLALLVALGLSGLASITLMYVTSPLYGGQYNRYSHLSGFEDAVVGVVTALQPLIKPVHIYGAYVTVLLSGWAALQCISVSKVLETSDEPKQRARGRLIKMLGGLGGILLALAVLVQVAAGTFTKWGMRALDESFLHAGTSPAVAALQHDPQLYDSRTEAFVSLHIRELNYPVGVFGFMLLVAMLVARTAGQSPQTPEKVPEDKKG